MGKEKAVHSINMLSLVPVSLCNLTHKRRSYPVSYFTDYVLRSFPAELFTISRSCGASIADTDSLVAQRVKNPPARQEIQEM